MEKLGYGWESLKDKYPRLIYAAVSGFGHTGPYADAARLRHGGAGDGRHHEPYRPSRRRRPRASAPRSAISRPRCSAPSASHRRCTTARKPGAGRRSMSACWIARWRFWRTPSRAMWRPAKCRTARHQASLHRAVRRLQNEGRLHRDRRRQRCAVRARGEGARPRGRGRAIRASPPIPRASSISTRCTPKWNPRWRRAAPKEWLALLEAEGVPCAPINDIAAVMADPQVLARNMIVTAARSRSRARPHAGQPYQALLRMTIPARPTCSRSGCRPRPPF